MGTRLQELTFPSVWIPLPKPVNLLRETERIKTRYGQRGDAARIDSVQAARRLLRTWRSGDEVSRLALNGLVVLFEHPSLDVETASKVAAILGEQVHRLSFGQLLALWQRGGAGFALTNAALHTIVRERVRRPNPRVPPWMVRSGNSRAFIVASTFEEPESVIANWLTSQRLPLIEIDEASDSLGVSAAIGIGEGALCRAIRAGGERWWRANALRPTLAWARSRTLPIQKATAERFLQDAGGFAHSLGALKALRSTDSDALIVWVRSTLGEPSTSPGRWEGISERARQIFEWFCLLDEFGKILEQFRTHAEDDRSEFWAAYLPMLTDARFYLARDAAVCLLRFGNIVVIEFGEVGNAAYVYSLRGDSRKVDAGPLRTARIPLGLRANDFKSQLEAPLVLGGGHFVQRLLHMGGWQWRARDDLSRLGVSLR